MNALSKGTATMYFLVLSTKRSDQRNTVANTEATSWEKIKKPYVVVPFWLRMIFQTKNTIVFSNTNLQQSHVRILLEMFLFHSCWILYPEVVSSNLLKASLQLNYESFYYGKAKSCSRKSALFFWNFLTSFSRSQVLSDTWTYFSN